MTPVPESHGLLAAIVASARVRAAAITRTTLADLERRAASRRPRPARFADALSRPDHVNVIAECKRRSPLKGLLRQDYAPAELAVEYERAGAAAVSVLTEPEFFDGGLDDLHAVAAEVSLPLLRKDFIVDERQLLEARAAGADAVLLIVAALDDGELKRMLSAACDLELAALVEVHSAPELDRALVAAAAIVGMNARNLQTMEVDPANAARLGPAIPSGVIRVAESGIRSRADIDVLRQAGYDAFLVGECLMRSESPGAALAGLLNPEDTCS
jgi:indole-3-glycerol phosphate synthase